MMFFESYVHAFMFVQVTVTSDGDKWWWDLRNITMISKTVLHAYRVVIEHCMHMSLCGSRVFDYVNRCEDVYMNMCIHVIIVWIDDVGEVWLIYIWLGDKVTTWILVVYLWWWFEGCCIYLNWLNKLTREYSIVRKWICIFMKPEYYVYLSSYLLYVELISYPLVTFWSPTSSWCRRAGWRRLIGVSFWG